MISARPQRAAHKTARARGVRVYVRPVDGNGLEGEADRADEEVDEGGAAEHERAGEGGADEGGPTREAPTRIGLRPTI